MDSFNNGSVWYSKLESEVLLTDLFGKLSNFPENEKAVCILILIIITVIIPCTVY